MSFKALKGQDKPIQILKCYIEQLRLSGGYLFIGPEGVGKNIVAKTLAKTINCEKEELDSCDNCASCLKIEKNQHPDVHIIDRKTGETEIKIDYIRQLQRALSLKPYEAKKKVFIINDAHNLNAESSNALLKILEEPPKDSLIILVSAKPSLLFKTIISRCKILKFSPLTRQELEESLKKDYSLDDALAHFLAYFSEGRIGSALRLKDEDIMRQKNRVINQFVIWNLANQRDSAFALDRDHLREYLNILASWFRDIYLIKIGMPYFELINLDSKNELLRQMGKFSFTDLERILNFISDSLLWLNENVNIKLLTANLRENIWKGPSL